MYKKFLFLASFLPILVVLSFAQDLSVTEADLRIEMRAEGGFHLFIKKKPDISSVLLTESTRDPALRVHNYAYRAEEWNPINGDEIRILDGEPIPKESRIYSLVSSTVKDHPELGQVFHIYIPYMLQYGYEGGRQGVVYVTDGLYLNIRAFALPYADYRGAFRDNPFTLEAKQEPPPGPPDDKYIEEAIDAFKEIADTGDGDLIISGGDDLVDKIIDALEKESGDTLDIVLCLDTTGSMKPYINNVRQKIIPLLKENLSKFSSFRIGMVLFKDYNDTYRTRVIPFTSDFNKFQQELNAIRVHGGGDIPEAVYEALYDGATRFPWEAESRVMILIGDAPPHPKPRGRITKEMTDTAVKEKDIKVHAILLPKGNK